jgi:hypothetical protein
VRFGVSAMVLLRIQVLGCGTVSLG